jgi:predicted O-linked N-acetylglucosamine transferase (SPINDLY family)
MDEFTNLYKKIKTTPHFINVLGNKLINEGVKIYNDNSIDLYTKENVLSKLIELFPNEPAFYYFMGFCFKDIDPNKAKPFFKKSYEINPYNIENLIDYCNLLLEQGNTKQVIEMDKTIPFGDYLKDIRLLNVFVNCKYKENHYKDLLNQLLYIIQEKSKTPLITSIDKELMSSLYLNTGSMFSKLGDHETSAFYTEKAFEFSNHYNLSVKTKFGNLQNLLLHDNYKYHDLIQHYEKASMINILYPNKLKYNFNHSTIKNSNSDNVKKIRVGYVSSDFINHAVSNFILPILKNHDKEKFEIYIFYNKKMYLNDLIDSNMICHHIFDLSDQEVAQLINNYEIDILFELNGYTENSRMGIFSLNPAPIQISYLGYPNTTGLYGIQYRITDNIVDNPESLQKYSENLIKIPKCFLLYQSINQDKPIIPRKTKETIILGSLNNEIKNSKDLLETWKKILEICPNTKLVIKLMSYDDLIERQKYYMSKLNVTKDRLLLITQLDNVGYNKLFSMVDIVLDTFPYSGTTTTCNSLYNSIPVVTLYNKDYHAHNVSSSILKNAGLDELIAYNNSDYISLVKKLVANPSKIDEYKETIGKKFVDSMNTIEFMQSYENILKQLHEKHVSCVINI